MPKSQRSGSELLRFLAAQCATGVAAGWLFLAGLLWTDAWGLWSRLAAAADPTVPVAMLLIVFAITFGSAAIATGVMMMPGARRDSDPLPRDPFDDRSDRS